MHNLKNTGGYMICADCGACKRKSGFWYWAGRKSKTQPPCSKNGSDYAAWVKVSAEAMA